MRSTLKQRWREIRGTKNGLELGDFTTAPRVIAIAVLAVFIGFTGAWVALGLLRLIGLFTNLFFFQRWSAALVSPAGNHLGWMAVLAPITGGIIVGFMARYGSERIRGHGIPEALESILIRGSKVEPKLALLKPVSSAIAIGSGGPFGAEGPIIMTGGAFGSLVAQLFHLTANERKTLLAAGAAAGMAATFAAPVSSLLLAVELLLFEWKPRSFVPVAIASITAGATRRYILGMGPLFPVPSHPAFIGPAGLAGCILAGFLAGILSYVMTNAVYIVEDAFHLLPIHWMWWPAIGGLVVGLGGLIFPQALGVGYETIAALLQGDVPRATIVGVLLVKSAIWTIALSSGTSGGVLAPLLMIGGALGGVEAMFLPRCGLGFWPLVSMGAALGGTMRVPFTAVIFVLELTHDINMLLPLLAAVTVAHTFTVLTLKRSILTEKVARRGYHLSREYSVDPMEVLSAREVMRTSIVALPASATQQNIAQSLHEDGTRRGQLLYPVVDHDRNVVGVATRRGLQKLSQATWPADGRLADVVKTDPVVVYGDEPLRVVVYRMADTGLTRFPVLESPGNRKLVGMISLEDLLRARGRRLAEERHRERVLRIRLPIAKRF
jgi:H+/Cl- antiporter ClcA/predicted transcriptional regulator